MASTVAGLLVLVVVEPVLVLVLVELVLVLVLVLVASTATVWPPPLRLVVVSPTHRQQPGRRHNNCSHDCDPNPNRV